MKAIGFTLFDPPFLSRTISPALFGPARWYDADSFEYLTNDAILTPTDPWDDVSSNNLDARSTALPPGTQPSKKSNWLNDRNAVRLVGTKRLLLDGGDLAMGDFTILCVCLSLLDSIFLSRDGFNRQIRVNRNNEHRASWFSGVSDSERISNEFSSDAGDVRLVGYRRRDNTTTPKFTFFDNANPVLPAEGEGCTNVAFGIGQIGIIDGGPLAIDIGELVIYDKALSDSQIQGLYENYFQPKFALPYA